MTDIPESHRDIFEKRSFANLATIDGDWPQVTPVWVEYDGTHIVFNTARGRKKDRNMQANPRVAFSVLDPDNPYRYVGVQGKVVEDTEEGAVEHIQKLAQKYTGRDYSGFQEDEVRVIYKVEPTNVWVNG